MRDSGCGYGDLSSHYVQLTIGLGELNYNISGMGFSMKARQVLPDGLIIISIPSEELSMIMENLKDMQWEPHWFNLGRDGFVKGVKAMEAKVSKDFPPDMVWNK
jgi:hypothetical protein